MEKTGENQEERKVDTTLKLGLPQFHKNHKDTKPQSNAKRVCESCHGGEDTPAWRRGPSGPGTLCNACGLKYSREQKKTNNAGPQE